jgi:signal transduction histidine kinase
MKDRLSILVADDEELIRRRVCLMLESGFSVEEAGTADSARKAARKGHDAVLLDIVFPDGNGIELCREIKDRDPHSTVVISSSMESVDAWDRAFQAGADGYLEKRELACLDPRKLVLMIENLVERNRLRRQAEETNRRQAELMSVLSHDVKAPFQALLGSIELLRNTPGIQEVTESVETLHRGVTDQLTFINSLLEFLRLESGMAGLRCIPLDMNLPVNQSLQNLSLIAAAKDVSLIPDLGTDLPTVSGDLGRICRLLNNLVTNAIKFSYRGGKVVVRTRAVESNGTSGTEISVEDYGTGIPPEQANKIFQRFRCGKHKGTEGESGTGLGLSICKEIVQLHGGRLGVSEEKRNGALVTAWFPALPLERPKTITDAKVNSSGSCSADPVNSDAVRRRSVSSVPACG